LHLSGVTLRDSDWVQASLNRPLTAFDQLWTDRSAVTELKLDCAAIRMGERSNISVLNLDERITQLQLSQSALRLDSTIEAHADFVRSWLEVLKNDKQAIFTAASQAAKAVDHILAC
jgi:antirestriction protein ArdC